MPGFRLVGFAQIPAKYLCKSCGLLLREAVQTCCGHHYCKTCLLEILTHEPSSGSVKCLDESCNRPLGKNSYFDDNSFGREILNIVTLCLYKDAGCQWMDAVKNAEDHYRECNFKPTMCTNAGCNQNIPLCALAQHQEKECPFRNVVCHSCNSAIKWTEHASHVCEYMHVTCPNCGKENIELRELNKHLDAKDGDCTQMECPYREYGCDHPERMDSVELKTHLDACVITHQLIFLRQYKRSSTNQHPCDVADTEAELGALKRSLVSAETCLLRHDWALSDHYQLIMHLRKDVEELKDLGVKKDGQ